MKQMLHLGLKENHSAKLLQIQNLETPMSLQLVFAQKNKKKIRMTFHGG